MLRTSAVYLGLAVMLILACTKAPSPTQNAISYGAAAITFCLAAVAIWSQVWGDAGTGVLRVGIVELVLSAGFVLTTRQRARRDAEDSDALALHG